MRNNPYGLALFVSGILLAAATPAFAGSQNAIVIVADDFNSGAPGTALTGTPVAKWNPDYFDEAPKWAANNYQASVVRLTGNGTVKGTVNDKIGIKVATPNQKSGMLSLKVDINFGVADLLAKDPKTNVESHSAAWAALALLDSVKASAFTGENTALLTLTTKGVATLYINGARPGDQMGVGLVLDFDITKTNTLELRYDRTTGTADIYVNGTKINNDPIAMGTTGNPLKNPSFGAVGALLYGGKKPQNASFDNFSYTLPDTKH